MEGPIWAAGLLMRDAAHTMDDTRGDAKAGLVGRHWSSAKPERLRGWVMMGLLIREVKISLSLHWLCNEIPRCRRKGFQALHTKHTPRFRQGLEAQQLSPFAENP